MKLTTALLTLITIFSTSNHIWAKETTVSDDDPRRQEYNWTVHSLFKDYIDARDRSEDAMQAGFKREFLRLECKMINSLEDLIKFTEANKDLDNSSIKITAEKLLKKELDVIKKGGVTKEAVCEAGLKKADNNSVNLITP